MRDQKDLRWQGFVLHLGHRTPPLLTLEPDAVWPGMFRIRHRDGRLSDMRETRRRSSRSARSPKGRGVMAAQRHRPSKKIGGSP